MTYQSIKYLTGQDFTLIMSSMSVIISLRKAESKIGEEQVNSIFHQIITDFEPQYINYRNLLPPHQFRLVKAIAVQDGVTQPTSGEFIRKNDLTSPSSVSTSLKALAEKEMIVYDLDKWNVYDVFFSRWLEYHYKE